MEIIPVGGYNEFGRNMTALRVKDDVLIIDMGIRLDRVMVHEDTDISRMTPDQLVKLGIIPDDSVVGKGVRAIILTHGHLDHLGAVSILAQKYNVPIIGTPYTIELVERELGQRSAIPLYTLEEGETLQVTPKLSVEFVRMTHSIPQTVMLVVHTPEGRLAYANDFKLDDTPVIGEKPDYRRMRELGKEGIKCLIVETTRVDKEGRTPSERIAQKLLEENILKSDREKGLIVTTFSSHISRISSIVQMAVKVGRTPVLLGRSMEKYVGIAERLKILKLPSEAHMYGDPESVKQSLQRILKDGREKYALIVTGHQGEPDALLSRMADKKLPYKIQKDDEVLFSADVIPNPINEANRYGLETRLKIQGARLFKDIHVSGHASMEDHRDFLKIIQPENIVPCHGDLKALATYAELAEDFGYTLNKDLFLARNGRKLEFRG